MRSPTLGVKLGVSQLPYPLPLTPLPALVVEVIYKSKSPDAREIGFGGKDVNQQDRPGYARKLTQMRWRNMMNRCYQPADRDYPNYGGRGIRVDPRWRDFEAFYRDTGDRPFGMTLDRPDNDGDYGPDNWQWATPVEQARNRRARRLLAECRRGHPYDRANTYVSPNGRRSCRACNSLAQRAYQERRVLA